MVKWGESLGLADGNMTGLRRDLEGRTVPSRAMSAGGFILDWLGTGASVSGVFASLFVHDVAQRVAIRFGIAHPSARRRAARRGGSTASATPTGVATWCAAWRTSIPEQHYIVVMNHQSLLDISMASDFLEVLAPRYVSKAELARGIPGVSYNLRRGGSALINRKDPAAGPRRDRRDLPPRARGWVVGGHLPRGHPIPDRRHEGLQAGAACARSSRTRPTCPCCPVTSLAARGMFYKGLTPVQRNIELGFIVHAPMTVA